MGALDCLHDVTIYKMHVYVYNVWNRPCWIFVFYAEFLHLKVTEAATSGVL